MVSENLYDRNQLALQQQPTSTALPGQGSSSLPGQGSTLQQPGMPPSEFFTNPLQAGMALGAGGIGLGARGVLAPIAAQAKVNLSNKAIALLSGSQIIGSLIAATMAIPNSIIGKEVNKLASELSIDLGNLRLAPFEQMYTMPVQDPNTGEWTFLFSDKTQLEKRMAEAGITKDLIPNRIIQLDQLRQANQQLIEYVGPIGSLPLQPGELPYSGAQRIAKEKTQAEQTAFQQDVQTSERITRATGQPGPEINAQSYITNASQPTAAAGQAKTVQVYDPVTQTNKTVEFDPNRPASEQPGFRPGENYVKDDAASRAAAQQYLAEKNAAGNEKAKQQMIADEARRLISKPTMAEIAATGQKVPWDQVI